MSSYTQFPHSPDSPKHHVPCYRRRCSAYVFLVLGAAIAAVLGFFTPSWLLSYVDAQILDEYVPPLDSDAYKDFVYNDRHDEAAEYLTFWLYNVTNPAEVLHNGAACEVAELGPFVYVYHEWKIDAQLYEYRGQRTVSYLDRNFYTPVFDTVRFDNVGDEPDTVWHPLHADDVQVTMLDPVFLGAAFQLRYNPLHASGAAADLAALCGDLDLDALRCFAMAVDLEGSSLSELMPGELGPFSSKPASAWLGLNMSAAEYNPVLAFVNDKLRGYKHVDNRFAYFYNVSQASDAIARRVLKRSAQFFDRAHVDQARSYAMWQNQTVLRSVQHTREDGANNVLDYEHAFAGWGRDLPLAGIHSSSHVHPDLDPARKPWFLIFLGVAARWVNFTYSHAVTHNGDIRALRYRVSPVNFAGSESSRDMFFTPDTYVGMSNQSSVHSYAPLWASTAHFVGYRDAVVKRWPVQGVPAAHAQLDETFLDVHPRTGLVVAAAERLSLNIILPVGAYDWAGAGLDWFNKTKMHELLIPLARFTKRGQLTDSNAAMLRELRLALRLVTASRVVGGLVGSVLVLAGVMSLLALRSQRKLEERLRERVDDGE